MNILITGGEGLIGTSLKKRLTKEGHRIVKDVDLRSEKDICEINKFIPKEKIDIVIHAAAHCKINQSVTNPPKTHKNNSFGTFQVLEFCRRNHIKKIVFFSSSRVLNKEKNPYTSSKLYGEELCKAYQQCYGIDYIIVRPSTVYGPFWDKTQRLMHIFIVNALTGKELTIYGDPKTKTLDFTYVDDFVEGVMLAINKNVWNKEFNISGGEEYNVHRLAQFIVKETKSSSKIRVREEETAQPQKVKLDLRDIRKLGYKPKVRLKKGVSKTIKFYKKLYEEYHRKKRVQRKRYRLLNYLQFF